MRVPAWVCRRRARDASLAQRPRDPRHRMPLKPLSEDPPDCRGSLRIRFEPLGTPPSGGVGLVRVRPGVAETVPVRRTPAQVTALLSHLDRHRGPHPDTGPVHLPLGRQPQHRHRVLVVLGRRSRLGRPLPASTAGQRSARTTGPSWRTGCRTTPARTHPPQPRPSLEWGPPSARPALRPAGGVPTPPSGSAPHRRTRPRSLRARGSVPRPAPVAAPATSPGPASPRSTPARRTRTASRLRCPASPGGDPRPPPMPPGRPHARPGQLPDSSQLSSRWPPPHVDLTART